MVVEELAWLKEVLPHVHKHIHGGDLHFPFSSYNNLTSIVLPLAGDLASSSRETRNSRNHNMADHMAESVVLELEPDKSVQVVVQAGCNSHCSNHPADKRVLEPVPVVEPGNKLAEEPAEHSKQAAEVVVRAGSNSPVVLGNTLVVCPPF